MIKRLQLNNFRNYEDIRLIIPDLSSIIVLYGNNGEGKTNILESISLFSEFGSLRRAKYDEIVNGNLKYGHWGVTMDTPICTFSMTYDRPTGRKVHKIDGNARRNLSEFAKNYYVLWLTYEMDRLFLQSPSARRDFIDLLCSVSSVEHMKNVRNYEKLTKDRLKILKNYVNGNRKEDIEKWLSVLENQIVELGIKIANKRMKTVVELEMNQIKDGFPIFKNEMTGGIEHSILPLGNSSEKTELYERELRDRRDRDGFSGMTTFGPNRSDWKVLYVDKMIDASLCSAGEQKMLLNGVFLSFVASRLKEDSRHLLLLLDDIVAYLDGSHRALLFSNIRKFVDRHAKKLSVWLSGTSKELFSDLGRDVTFFLVHNGIVKEG
ncbi:MAG: AAA family ATPase [Holosporales bacterium]|jgi:DNA replication and repair protein RecF|nr:AAA family ATPase [Holosporales bacterium]